MRKIVHIDMDAFYASVEQRDDSQPRGKPGIVAWRGNLSVQEQRFRLVGAVVSNFLHPEDISAQPAIFG